MDDNFNNYDARILRYHNVIRECMLDIGKQKRTNPKIAELTSYLMFHESLTQKQLKKLTGFSIGSISTYLTILSELNFVNKELIPGTHTYKYSSKVKMAEYVKIGFKVFLDSFNPSSPILEKKREQLQILAEKNEEGAVFLLNRINSILKTFEIYKEILAPASQKLKEVFTIS